MTRRIYLASTGVLCAWMLLGFAGAFFRVEEVTTTIARLGYPDYFPTMLGIAKGCGAAVLLAPFAPAWLKNWVYGAVVVELLCAFFSYNAVGLGVGESIAPLTFLIVVVVSFSTWRSAAAYAAPGSQSS